MPILRVSFELTAHDIAHDTAEKLLGRQGLVRHKLAHLLADKLMESSSVKLEVRHDHVYDFYIASASVVVGQEVVLVSPISEATAPYEPPGRRG